METGDFRHFLRRSVHKIQTVSAVAMQIDKPGNEIFSAQIERFVRLRPFLAYMGDYAVFKGEYAPPL